MDFLILFGYLHFFVKDITLFDAALFYSIELVENVLVFYERLLALRADNVLGIHCIVKVNLAFAVFADRAVELCIVVFAVAAIAAITVVIVAVAAVAIAIIVITVAIAIVKLIVNDLFNCAEVLVKLVKIVERCINV